MRAVVRQSAAASCSAKHLAGGTVEGRTCTISAHNLAETAHVHILGLLDYLSTGTMPSDSAKRRQQQKREKRQADQKKRAAGGTSDTKPNLDTDADQQAATSDQPSTDAVLTGERSSESASVSSSKPKDQASASERAPPPAKPSPKISPKSCAGALASHPESRDLHVERLSLTFHGAELLCDAKLELNCGQRYGLVGLNGCGEYRPLRNV